MIYYNEWDIWEKMIEQFAQLLLLTQTLNQVVQNNNNIFFYGPLFLIASKDIDRVNNYSRCQFSFCFDKYIGLT